MSEKVENFIVVSVGDTGGYGYDEHAPEGIVAAMLPCLATSDPTGSGHAVCIHLGAHDGLQNTAWAAMNFMV